jgi:UDP-N-acetylglucosamine transferase subunit ALG13
MIFVTIGTQEPFDRLIKAIDKIAPQLGEDVIVQTFKTDYEIKNMKVLDFIPPKDFETYFEKASLIVSHAGMGTIISALVKQKALIVMPRMVEYGEHRNDHQMSTARRFEALKYIEVAYNETELIEKLLHTIKKEAKPLKQLGEYASETFINSLSEYIHQ